MHGKFPTPRDITQDIMRMIRIQEVPMLMTIGFGLHPLDAPGVLALAANMPLVSSPPITTRRYLNAVGSPRPNLCCGCCVPSIWRWRGWWRSSR